MNHLVVDETSGMVYLGADGQLDNVDQLLLLDPPGKHLLECGRLFTRAPVPCVPFPLSGHIFAL